MDRANVGGNQSGQQSGYISRGASTGNNKWSIDGVDITDMAATGASPIYYDFDMLEEMQVTTGGADVTQQTGGVGINLVTKSGTDRFKGNARALVTDEKFEDDNITPRAARRRAPARRADPEHQATTASTSAVRSSKSKLWCWGSYGAQDIKVGVVGFYKNTPNAVPAACRSTRARPTRTLLRSCLSNRPDARSTTTTWKLTYVPFKNNRLNFQNTWAEKVRNARDAGDLRPVETTVPPEGRVERLRHLRLADRSRSPFWKVARSSTSSTIEWLVDVMWAHLGNNFVLDFHEDCAARRAGRASRSRPRDVGPFVQRARRSCVRPTASTWSAATSCRRSWAAITRSSSATAGATRTRRA